MKMMPDVLTFSLLLSQAAQTTPASSKSWSEVIIAVFLNGVGGVLSAGVTAVFLFALGLLFKKRIVVFIRHYIHKWYGIEIDQIFQTRSEADDDIIKDLDKTHCLDIWTSRGIDLSSSEKFQRILERAYRGHFKIRVLVPHPFPPNDEYDWTEHRNSECEQFDKGMAPGVLGGQILATLKYLQTPIRNGLVEVRLVNTLQLGRLILTDSNAYFAPYTERFHGSSSRVMKCPSSGMLCLFFKRIFDSHWEAAVKCEGPDVTATVSIVRINNVTGMLFDLDGSIVDSMAAHAHALTAALDQPNLKLGKEEFTKQFGGLTTVEIVRTLLDGTASVTEEQIAEIANKKEKIFLEEVAKLEGFPTVLELIKSLKGKMKLGLVSGSRRAVVDAILKKLELVDVFEVIVSADDRFPSKPDPRGFMVAATKMKVDPIQCLVVEDSEAGFRAASEANMRCVDANCLAKLIRQNRGEEIGKLIASSALQSSNNLSGPNSAAQTV